LSWLVRASIPTRQLRTRLNRRVCSQARRALPGVPVPACPMRVTPSWARAASLAAVPTHGRRPPGTMPTPETSTLDRFGRKREH
jgi:hypothetical protein